MRFVNVFSVFLAAVVCLVIPQHGAIAFEGSDFIAWALEQGEGLDRTWGRITTGAAPGAATGSSTAPVGGSGTVPAAWNRSTSSDWNRTTTANWNTPGGSPSEWSPFNGEASWIHSTSGFVHKGELERFPLSTRTRSGPSRGMSKLENPAKARLNTAHDYRRIPNARVPSKDFFHGRSGKWRITARTGTRISPFNRRSRVSSRASRRASRPR